MFRATIDEIAQGRDAFIQQLPVDGAISRHDARFLEALERGLNAWRHALDALTNPGSNHQTVNDVWVSLQDQQIIRATIDQIAQRRDAFIQQLPVDGAISQDDASMLEALERTLDSTRHALDALSNYQTAPTAPPAPAQAPVPIPPRQLGLPPGSVTPPRCSPTMQYRGQRQGSVEEQDCGHQQGCEQGYEVQQGISRQDLGGKGYGVGPTWAPPASAVVTGPSYDKGGREVGPRFTP